MQAELDQTMDQQQISVRVLRILSEPTIESPILLTSMPGRPNDTSSLGWARGLPHVRLVRLAQPNNSYYYGATIPMPCLLDARLQFNFQGRFTGNLTYENQR